MEREDPLEKLERKEQERQQKKGSLALLIILAVVAVALAGILVYVLNTKNQLVEQLNVEKEELTHQIVVLQTDFQDLSSDYETINAQLDSSREEIAQLVEKVKVTEATNRTKIRQYEKELGTLRSIMKSYIVQIDSLNTLNRQLTEDAAKARREAAETRNRNAELNEQVASLNERVAAGSVIKAGGFKMEAFGSNDKLTDRSSRVKRLLISLSLNANEIADRGPFNVYVRVVGPDGALLKDGRETSFVLGEETLEATASREVDYQGNELEMGIYVNNIPTYTKGIYTATIYSSQAILGSVELLLR